MNKILITKVGFYDDVSQLLDTSGIANELCGSPQFISGEYRKQLLNVFDLLSNKPQKKHYNLIFPERFYHNSLTFTFWDKIYEYIKQGITFNVKTSDFFALSRISKKKKIIYENNEEHLIKGWNVIECEKTDGESTCKYDVLHNLYGSKFGTLYAHFSNI